MPKSLKLSIILVGIFVKLVVFFWLFFISYNPVNMVSIERNLISGELKLNNAGLKITPPWVFTVRIKTNPTKVCVECYCKNITCVLISFRQEGWLEFVNREGFRYYWLSNRISINLGHENEYRGIDNILRGYAFDDEKYEFLNYYDNI